MPPVHHIFSDDPMSDQIKVDQFADDAVHDTLEGQLVAYDVEDDVAIVAVAGMRIVTAIPVASAKSKTRVGAPVLTGGCDGGARPTVEATVISDIGRYCGPANLCVASCPSHGRSGGGLMSRDQQLIGICSGIDTTVGDGVYAGLRCVREQFDKAVVQLSARGDAFIPSAAIDQRPPVSAGPTSSRSTTDVVCYIRGRNHDDSRSVVLRNVTAEFLNSIESEIRRQRNRENPAPLPRQNDPSYAR